MKKTVEVKSVDVGESKYSIKLDDGRTVTKTIKGKIYVQWGWNEQDTLSRFKSDSYLPELAGKWPNFTTDKGECINTSHVVSAKITKTSELVLKYTKVHLKSFWSESTSFHTEKGQL